MATIERDRLPYNPHNEDFDFDRKLGDTHVMIVGDFIQSGFNGLDDLAKTELNKIFDASDLTSLPVPELLIHITSAFNSRLLKYRDDYRRSSPDKVFQCSAVFAALEGTKLSYLTCADCRIAVRRGDHLITLNGTIWRDATGHPLPPAITTSLEIRPGDDPPPYGALGHAPIEPSQLVVKKFPLQSDDTVLLYSDGVDKALSPAQLLGMLSPQYQAETLKETIARILRAARDSLRGADDRTLLIAAGPHEDLEQETQRVTEESLTRLTEKVADVESDQSKWQEEIRLETTEILDKINKKLPSLAQLETILGELRSREQRSSSLNDLLSEITALKNDLSDFVGSKTTQGWFRTAKQKPNLVTLLDTINDLPNKVFSPEGLYRLSHAISNEIQSKAPKEAVLIESDRQLLKNLRLENQTITDTTARLSEETERLTALINKVENHPQLGQLVEAFTTFLAGHRPTTDEGEERQRSAKGIATSGTQPAGPPPPVSKQPPLNGEHPEGDQGPKAKQSSGSRVIGKTWLRIRQRLGIWTQHIRDLWSRLKLRIIWTVVFVLLLAAFVFFAYWYIDKSTSSDNTSSTEPQLSSDTDKPFRLIQDGQRILFEDKKGGDVKTIGYKMSSGIHEILKNGHLVKNDADAYEWLSKNVPEVLLFRPPSNLRLNHWVYPVIEQDTKPFTVTDQSGRRVSVQNPCSAFLSRINNSIPEEARMGQDDFLRINGLSGASNCNTLKAGQLLIVRYEK